MAQGLSAQAIWIVWPAGTGACQAGGPRLLDGTARSLRLAAEDVALSRRKQGFESPRERQVSPKPLKSLNNKFSQPLEPAVVVSLGGTFHAGNHGSDQELARRLSRPQEGSQAAGGGDRANTRQAHVSPDMAQALAG